jgi:hypothetical protein
MSESDDSPASPRPDPSPTWASRIGVCPEGLGDGPVRFFFFQGLETRVVAAYATQSLPVQKPTKSLENRR